jgi:hypothetical protein
MATSSKIDLVTLRSAKDFNSWWTKLGVFLASKDYIDICDDRDLVKREIAEHGYVVPPKAIEQPLGILPHAPPHFSLSIKIESEESEDSGTGKDKIILSSSKTSMSSSDGDALSGGKDSTEKLTTSSASTMLGSSLGHSTKVATSPHPLAGYTVADYSTKEGAQHLPNTVERVLLRPGSFGSSSFNAFSALNTGQTGTETTVFRLCLCDQALWNVLGLSAAELWLRRTKALGVILSTLPLPTQTAFQYVRDPCDLLDLLELKFRPNNQSRLFRLFNTLSTIRLALGESLESYFY